MTRGVNLTLQVIAGSKNQAAAGLLESASHSSDSTVRNHARAILVSQQNPQAIEAIIRGFDPDDPEIVDFVNTHRDKIVSGLRNVIAAKNIELTKKAFQLAYTQEFYEVLPALAAYCLGPARQEKGSASLIDGFLNFLNKYTAALDQGNSIEQMFLRNTLMPELQSILLQKANEYRFSRNELILTVYLNLYPFFADTGAGKELKTLLRISASPIYQDTYRWLLNRSEPYLFLLITRCLGLVNPPYLASKIFSERYDAPFLSAIFKSIKKSLSSEFRANLQNLPPLGWITSIENILNKLDGEAQSGLVSFLQNIKLTADELQASLIKIFEHGTGEGRLAALSALADFSDASLDRLFWDAVEDEDPTIQVEAMTHLHARGIPGAASRILQFADSPHEEVRTHIPKLLPNFRFSRFLQMFDQLDEEQRRQLFNTVSRLDQQTSTELTKMLYSDEPIVRAKALLCIDYCHSVVPMLEDALCYVLAHDTVPRLRVKAAEQLAAGQRNESRMTLVHAMHRDTDSDVRAAAKTSLENRPANWG